MLVILQALPLVTLLVGKKTDSGICRVLTLASIGKDNYVEFPIPSNKNSLSPGEPMWANYVKGVVANYKGGFYEFTAIQRHLLVVDIMYCKVTCFIRSLYT